MSHNRGVFTLPSRRRLLRAGSLVAVGATAAAALAGCTSDPGAAAVVGNSRISDNALHDVVDADYSNATFAQAKAGAQAAVTRQDLSTLIVLQLLTAGAKAVGVTVTPAEVNAEYAQIAKQEGGAKALDQAAAQQGTAPASIPDILTEQLLLQRLAEAESGGKKLSQTQLQSAESTIGLQVIEHESTVLGVHVDPRYGRWVAAHGDVEAVTQPFSKAAGSSSAAAAPAG